MLSGRSSGELTRGVLMASRYSFKAALVLVRCFCEIFKKVRRLLGVMA